MHPAPAATWRPCIAPSLATPAGHTPAPSSSPTPINLEDVSISDANQRSKRFQAYAEYIGHIRHYVTTATHTPGFNKKTKKAVYKATSKGQYITEGSSLYYCVAGRKLQVITTEAERDSVLHACHSTPSAGHTGINNTCTKISERYWWKGIREDVQHWISHCDACQRQKLKTLAPQLQPIKIKSPLHMVGIDLIGPLKETEDGYKFVLTLTDYFTKFVDLFAQKSKSAEEVCRGIRNFIYRWGPPEKILSDRGKEFVNKVNEALGSQYNIQRLVTSAYHPQCNGLDEQMNQTLKDRLAKLVNKRQGDWNLCLEEVAYSVRTQKQSSTNFSPFFLMFNRQPCLVSSMLLEDNHESEMLYPAEVTEEDHQAYVESMSQLSQQVHTQVLTNVEGAQERQVQQYQKRAVKGVKVFDLKPGDLFLRCDMKNVRRKGDRMAKKWLGPYRILDIDNHQRVELKRLGYGQSLKDNVPYAQFKPYRQPTAIASSELSTATSPGGSPAASPGGSPAASPGGSPAASPGGSPAASPGGSAASPGDSPTASPGGSPAASPGGSPAASPGGSAASPGGSPTVSPGGSPAASPGGSPAASPGGSAAASPGGSAASPGGSAAASPGGSPATSPGGSPAASPGGSPAASPGGSPTASPGGSPTASPGGSPAASPGGSPAASPSPAVTTPSPAVTTPSPPVTTPSPPVTTPSPAAIAPPFTAQRLARKRPAQDLSIIKVTTAKSRRATKQPVKHVSRLVSQQERITAMRSVITGGTLLTDEVVNHAQALLAQEFPKVDGLQDMALFEDNGCVFVGTPCGPFVQIINVFSNHWICLSNIMCSLGTVSIYDSIYHGKTSPKLKKQIGWLLYTKFKQMNLEWPDMQKQKGGADCGLFSIAVADALCRGLDPTICSWNQPAMRRHLAQCFRDGKMSAFPTKGQPRQPATPKVEQVPVFCNCRQPNEGRRIMVECCSCKEWYHRTCEVIPSQACQQTHYQWFCSTCR